MRDGLGGYRDIHDCRIETTVMIPSSVNRCLDLSSDDLGPDSLETGKIASLSPSLTCSTVET